MEKYKLFSVLMKNKFLSTLLILLIGLGYSVESSAQDFYLKTHNAEYISCNADGVLAKGTTKQVWTVSESEGYTYISTEVGEKTLYLTLDASQIANNSGKITSKFFAAEDKTNIYLFDGSKSGSAASIVTSVAAGGKCYLVSPEITDTDHNGYYIFRHDYEDTNTHTIVPIDAKLMVTGSGSDSYKLSVGDPFSKSTITISTNSSANLNTQVIFEKAETPSVKYGKVTLGEYNTSFGNATITITGVTLGEAFSSETAIAGAATKELTLTATANEGYVFKGWKLNGELIEGSATSPFTYTYSYSSESDDPTADVFTPVFKEKGKLTECYITYAGSSSTYYISMSSTSALQRSTTEKQVWKFGDADDNGMISLSTEYSGSDYFLARKSSSSGSGTFYPTTDETSLYFFDASSGKLVSELALDKSYFIVAKSSSGYYVMRYSSSSSSLTAQQATTSNSNYKLNNTTFDTSTTLTISSSNKSSCTFTLASASTKTYYGKVNLIGVNSTVIVSESSSAPSTGYTAESSDTWSTETSGESKDYYFYSKPSDDSEFVCYATDAEGKNPIESTSSQAAESSNNYKYKYAVTPAASEDEGNPTTTTIYAVYKKNGSSEQPTTGDGLYLMNMGNGQYLQMVKKATDTASSNNNDGQLGFVSSIDESTTSWVFTQYSSSSLVKFADSGDQNVIYFGNPSSGTWIFKLVGIDKYNKSSNLTAKADNQSSAGEGSKYNCYLYKIDDYSSSASSLTATLATTAEADGYYFIASANVQSGTGMMLMGNSLSSGNQITIQGTNISSTPGSSSITVNVSNIKNYVYQFVSDGSQPQPTATYYGKVKIIGVNSTVIVSESSSAPSTEYAAESSDTWSTETSGESKDYYFYSKPSDDSEFVCYATDSEGKNPITSTSSEAAASSNNYKYKYAVTPAASEDEGNPTTTTIYAVYKQKSQETKYYGTVTAAIASNSTDGGTVAATSSYSTPSADKYTAGTSSAVRNADSGSKMHLYLFAKAADGYDFKGWSTNADGSGNLLTSTNNYYQVEFDATSTNEASPTDGGTYYAVFEKESEPELFGTKCFLMNGANYIGYANGVFTTSTTDKQEWEFGTTSNFITPLSTLVNNQVNYLGYTTSAYNTTGQYMDLLKEDNSSVYFFDATTGKPASALEVGKSYYIVLKSTNSGSSSRYVVSCDNGTLKTNKANDKDDNYKLSSTTITSDVTITLGSSVKAACTFTLASIAPVAPTVKYGKVTLAAAVSNGTYSIESGATSGELITSGACAGAATQNIVLSAEAEDGYVFKGWSVDGGATILSGSNAASYTYTFSFSSEDEFMPTEVTITPVFEKLPELSGTKCFLMNGENYIGYANGAFTSSTTDKQEWAFGTTSDFITPLSTLVNNQVNYLGYPTSVSGSTTVFADVISPDNNTLYFFDTETNKPASSLEVGKSYYIVIKSTRSESTSRYVVSYENGTLKTTKANDNDNYKLSNTTITSDVTITLGSSVKAACTFTLASIAPAASSVKYGKVTLAAAVSNGTYSITSGATSGELITSEACAGAATQNIVLSATANDGYTFKGWSVDGGETILSESNVASYTYTFSFDSEVESTPTEVTLTPVFEESGSSEQPAGDGLYLKNMGNSKYLQMVNMATDDADHNKNDGQLGFVESIDDKTTGWVFTQYSTSSFVLFADMDGSNFVYFGNKGDTGGTYAYKLTGMAKYNKSGNPEAVGNQSSAGAGSKYNCYLYKITDYSESGTRFTATLTTTAEAGEYYFIASADLKSGTGMMLMGNSLSSGSQVTIDGTLINSTPGSSSITVEVSNIQNYVYQYVSGGTTPQPTTKTLYGKLIVSATNGTVFASTNKEAASGETAVNVSKTVSAANATETIYLNAAPNDKYAFLGWSETEGGEIIEGSNVEGFAYTFTFDGTEGEPTEKTLYAVFEYKYTTYYGTFNVSAGEGGTAFFAAETGATEGSVTEDVNEEVLKTVTSASKTFYLNATAPSDKYEFLGWSETEGGEILEGSNVEDFAYTFTFDGTEDEPTVKTLYAVFEYKYTTYYGTFNVSAGEGGKAFFAAETGATEGKVTEDVNEEVLKTVTSVSKTYYLNATPSDKYDFLGWAETEGGEILEGSNVEDFEYTFTFDGTEDEPTVKTLYAVFENKYTTYCGTFNVSAGEGGTAFIAEASGATEGSVTEAVTKVVDKTETSASKTFYLNATAKSGYTFKGWSETEGGEIFVGTNDKDFEYTFTFDGTEDKRTVKTLYAVFEDTKPGDVIPSTDITAYDNILYFNDESTSINRDFNLVLNLKNAAENVTAFQCDVLLPRGIDWEMTTDKNGNEVLKAPAFNTERTDETYHNVTCKRIDGRTIRIIVISTNKDIILGTEGAILTLPLSVADDMEGGDYNIFINNIVIATDQQEQTTIDQTVSKVSVADFNLGDVNSDGQINVTDIVAIVAYMLNESPTPFVFKAADVHADNEINVTDIVGLIDIINTPKANAANAANGMRSGSYQDSDYTLDIVCNGQNVTLNMNNRDNITAFQCDVELSEGVEWVSANGGYAMPEFNKEAGRTDRDRHNISVKRLEDGKFRVIVYSLNNDEFFGSEGAVLNLPLVFTKDASCTISNIVLSKTNADSEYLNGSTYSFDATSIDYIKNAQDANDVIFNINGIRNNKLMKGVNIINGVKVMVNE